MAFNYEDHFDIAAGFDYGSGPYMFEPEYTNEELLEIEQQALLLEQQQQQQANDDGETRRRHLLDPVDWCKCQGKKCCKMTTDDECLCCSEFYLWHPDVAEEDPEADVPCVTSHEDFMPMINRGVLETFFLTKKINWEQRPDPEGENGHLSNE